MNIKIIISFYILEFFATNVFCFRNNLKFGNKKYKYCNKCIRISDKTKPVCQKCPALEILNNLKIMTPDQTLNEIIYKKKSIARYGDGEYQIIFGNNIRFQKFNQTLSEKLKNILITSNNDNLLIGNDNSLRFDYLNIQKNFAKNFWNNWINIYKYYLLEILNLNKTYGSTRISRFYIDYIKNDSVSDYVNKLKKVWNKQDIVIIEGEQSRLGVCNDLFDNANSIQRIICPSENAFDSYDKILEESLKLDKNRLILIALGPTATVLAYDLFNNGYQAIDIGHVDIEYEWYLRNATYKIKIENKYVNEVNEGDINIQNVTDKNYYKQIISKILN